MRSARVVSLLLPVLVFLAGRTEAQDLCRSVAQGECYNPKLDSRICLDHGYTIYCMDHKLKCCKKWAESSLAKKKNLCESVYKGTCFSLLTSGKKCKTLATRSSTVCNLTTQACCLEFEEVTNPDVTGTLQNAADCGVPSFSVGGDGWRIVGGDRAQKGAWPWQVSFKYNDIYKQHFCGGSIIDNQWVITAAHCVTGQTPRQMKIIVGQHHQFNYEPEQTAHDIERVYMHEQFDRYSDDAVENDIALVKLKVPIKYADHVKPVCLPRNLRVGHFDGHQECWITGWGETQGTGDESYLQELQSAAWFNSQCIRQWGRETLKASMICIGSYKRSACMGDSGGPMVCKENGKFVLAGVTSFGHQICGTLPAVYTRVTSFMDWIDKTIQRDNLRG